MPFAIHLALDADSAARLLPLVELIERVSPGALTPTRANISPHISLAVYEEGDPDALAKGLERFVTAKRAFPVKLSSIGVFPGASSVLFAAPVATDQLLSIHRQFHDELAFASAACWPYYLPGNWVPHVTLGERVRSDEVAEAMRGAVSLWRPVTAELSTLSLVRFHPVVELWERRLPA